MMADLGIYGAGGFGREVALMIKQINACTPTWNPIGFFDDGKPKRSQVDDLPVIGGIDDLNAWERPLSLILAVAEPRARRAIAEKIMNFNIQYPVLIHPNCHPGSPKNQFGKGCIVTSGVILTTGITIGDFVIINLACTIGHDVTLDNFTSVMPLCSISGNVQVGEATLVGTGARMLQNLRIGKNCKIGAGAVVISDVGDDQTIVGVPARPIKNRT